MRQIEALTLRMMEVETTLPQKVSEAQLENTKSYLENQINSISLIPGPSVSNNIKIFSLISQISLNFEYTFYKKCNF